MCPMSLEFILCLAAEYLKCPTHQQHFEKIVGYRPSAHYDMNMNFNFMKNSDVIPEFKQLNVDCWSQCYKDPNCFGYIYFLTNNTCFGYSIRGISDDPYYTKYHKLSLSPDANAVFFQKMCLKGEHLFMCSRWCCWEFKRVNSLTLNCLTFFAIILNNSHYWSNIINLLKKFAPRYQFQNTVYQRCGQLSGIQEH